jgi:superfamily II DNA/RNA helicase
VATLYRSLERHGYSVGALHGDMDQHARLKTLDSFRDGQIKLLVASDVAARGLDIPAVSHIFNFDVPTHAEDYVHRTGRTGRAGRSGEAVTLVTRPETKYVEAIERLIGNEIAWAPSPAGLEFSPPAGEAGRDEPRARRGGERRSRAARGRDQRRAEGPRERPHGRRDRDPEPRSEAAPRPRRRAAEEPNERAEAAGFTGHVPAFLLRPVRMPVDGDALEEV